MQGSQDDRSLDAIARRLKTARKALGFADRQQAQFAANAGIKPNTYNQWEKARGRPRIDEAIMLVDTYGVTLDYIYLGDERRVSFDIVEALRKAIADSQGHRR